MLPIDSCLERCPRTGCRLHIFCVADEDIKGDPFQNGALFAVIHIANAPESGTDWENLCLGVGNLAG